jgi:hypothetical protein
MTILSLILAQQVDAAATGSGLGPGALAFMLLSMGSVAALTAWCFWRILATRRHFDPDGTGPDKPPVKGRVERKKGGA